MRTIPRSQLDAAIEAMSPLDKARLDHELGLGRAPYQQYANDPVGFATQVLGNKITPGQIEVLESVRDHRVTVVMSANSVGKTHAGGTLAHWFFHSLPNSKIITVAAPPIGNLHRLLWGEIGACARQSPEIMEGVPKVRSLYYERHDQWWMEGRPVPSSGSVEERQAKFSGVHAPFLLFILDEGDAIPSFVYRGIESCMTGGDTHMVVFFNPRYQGGPVQKLIDEGANVITLSAFDHPNVQSGKEIILGAVTRAITVERINKWSRAAVEDEAFDKSDPSWFEVPGFLDGVAIELSDGTTTQPLVGLAWRKVKDEYPEMCHIVLARYPGQAVNQLIPRAWIVRAQNLWLLRREMYGDVPPEGIRPAGGLDVADFGPDPSCLCLRYELWVAQFIKMNGMNAAKIAKWAAGEFHDAGGDTCTVDDIGVGSGVYTIMQDQWDDYGLHGDCELEHRAVPMRVSWSATDDRFHRMREQMFWGVRDWLQRPGAMLPPGEAILIQAQAIRYWYGADGKIRVTGKENIKAQIHQSPDEFESLALSLVETDDEVLIGYG